ncbi:hypothetical protein ACJMK2_032502 [Sinanodonta woodiana]|uniref:Uncharacterized protein n=1 Tax=Sinanodonta woodiana TaxID=1069815 RepID=A0ABD3X5I4_SINWO
MAITICVQRNSKRVSVAVLCFALVLISFYGTYMLADILQKRFTGGYLTNCDSSIQSNLNNRTELIIDPDQKFMQRLNINMHNSLPTDEITEEAFRNNGPLKVENIIHQVWIGKTNDSFPVEFKNFVSSFKTNHPNYVYMFWTEKAAKTFVEDKFPNMLYFYENYVQNLQRADAIRYMILHEYGGIYADLDIVSLRPLDPILRKYFCIIAQEPHFHPIFYNNFYGLASNALMACRRHHPFMKIMVENLPSFSVFGDELDSTGPRLVTLLHRNYVADNAQIIATDREGIYLAPPEYFMPSSDPTLKTRIEKKCVTKNLNNLELWACERFKKLGMGGPTNYTFTDHQWSHVFFSDLQNRKYIAIKDIVPDAKFYVSSHQSQAEQIKH